MADLSILQPLFREWELVLSINKPACIQKIKLCFDFEKAGTDVYGQQVLLGNVNVYLETGDAFTYDIWTSCAVGYTNEEERKKAEDYLINEVYNCMKTDLEGYAPSYWEMNPLEEMIWNKKGEE